MRTLALVSLVFAMGGCSLIFNPNEHTELYGKDAGADTGVDGDVGVPDGAIDAGTDASDGGPDPLCDPAPSFDHPEWVDCTGDACRCAFSFHTELVTPSPNDGTGAYFEDALSIAWPGGTEFSIGYVVRGQAGAWGRLQTFDEYLNPTVPSTLTYLAPSSVHDLALGVIGDAQIGVVVLADRSPDRPDGSGVWVGTIPSPAGDLLTELTGQPEALYGRPAVTGDLPSSEGAADPRFFWREQSETNVFLASLDATDYAVENYASHDGPTTPTARNRVPMTGSRGRLVLYDDGDEAIALWHGQAGAPFRFETPGRLGRAALAYRGQDVYVVGYPVEEGIALVQMRCAVQACTEPDCEGVRCCPLETRTLPSAYKNALAFTSLADGTVVVAGLDSVRQYSAIAVLSPDLDLVPLNGITGDVVPDAGWFRVNYARESLGDLAVAARIADGRLRIAIVAGEYTTVSSLGPTAIQVRSLDGCQ